MAKRTTLAAADTAADESAKVDVSAVVDAAAKLSAASEGQSAEDAELAEAKAVFLSKPDADLLITMEGSEPADVAREQAQALVDAMNAAGIDDKDDVFFEFPCQVRILNNSAIALAEKITGAFLAAGGNAIVSLHDEEHAQSVSESLRNLVLENYLSPKAIVVELV
jgi:hypothetical protein